MLAVNLLQAGFTALLVVFSVVAHELAHGYAALHEGDRTAERAGRLTWNPLRHVDPVFSIALPIATWVLSGGAMLVGGAKPVPVNPQRYRDGRRSDVLVSLAGVAANACIMLALVAALPVFARCGLRTAAVRAILINAWLIAFNLLPIPPLDGWRVLRCARAR